MNKDIPIATIRSRMIAFVVDMSITQFMRMIFGRPIIKFWLEPQYNNFIAEVITALKVSKLEELTREDARQILLSNAFLGSKFFLSIVLFICITFFLSILYNFICFLTLKRASVGQRIMRMHVSAWDGSDAKIWQLALRAFAISIPWMLMFFLCCQILLSAAFDIVMITDGFCVLGIILLCAIWHNMIFFTNNRTMLQDHVSRTRILFDNTDREETVFERLIPNPRAIMHDIKIGFADSFERMRNFKKSVIKIKESPKPTDKKNEKR